MNNHLFATVGLASLLSLCAPEPTGLGEGAGLSFEKTVISTQGGAAWMEPTDLDGDGYDEYLLTCLSEGIGFSFPPIASGGAYVLRREGGAPQDGGVGEWTADTQFNRWSGVDWPNISTLFDLDNDGIEDWVIGAGFIPKPTGRLVWMKGELNDGVLSFGEIRDIELPDGGWYHEAVPVDLDGDGDTDFVTSHNATSLEGTGVSVVEWYENHGIEGVASFTRHFIAERGGTVVTVYDVDSDGDEDIILPQFFGGDALIWLEQTGLEATEWVEHRINATTGKGFIVKLADMNGDGQLDLLYGNHNHQDSENPNEQVMGLYYWEIPSADVVRELTDWDDYQHIVHEGFEVDGDDPAKYGAPGVFNFGDIDNDGDLDVTASGDGDLGLYLFVQQTPDSFEQVLIDSGLPNSGSQHMTDIDGDGDLDIIWAIYGDIGRVVANSEINVYLQN